MNIDSQTEARGPYDQALAALTSRLLAGDAEVLRDVLRLLGARTERALRRRLPHLLTEADSEDALSIALFRLWQRRDRFDPARARLDRWFYIVARNAAVDLLRAKSLHPEEALGNRVESVPASRVDESFVEKSTIRLDLERALAMLPDIDRRILLSGLTETELSRELGLKPGNIRVRRMRSKIRLRSLLREMGYAPEEDDHGSNSRRRK